MPEQFESLEITTRKKEKVGDDSKEGLDFVYIFRTWWAHRIFIAYSTFLVTLGGLLFAFLTPSIYRAEAVIMPKELDTSGEARTIFSQFGALGGMVAAQLGGGGGTIQRMELISRSYDVSELVIQRNNLMPILYPHKWDAKRKTWKSKNPNKIPKMQSAIELLDKKYLKVTINPKYNCLNISIEAREPVLAANLVQWYLEAINIYIRNSITRNSNMNRVYLDSLLPSITDPLIREKVLQMVAVEIERAMLVSSQCYELIERPIIPLQRSWPKRKTFLFLSMIIGFSLSLIGVSVYVNYFRRFLSFDSKP
jgi:uncharacterized protein involved in exopolysaccharide biosynthesis